MRILITVGVLLVKIPGAVSKEMLLRKQTPTLAKILFLKLWHLPKYPVFNSFSAGYFFHDKRHFE
jgi:hypothetical protein